jgi:hypothetical protein
MKAGRVCHFLLAGGIQLAGMRALQHMLPVPIVLLCGVAVGAVQYVLFYLWEYKGQGWIARTFTFAGWDPAPDWHSVAVVPFGAWLGGILWIWLPW